ncbi:serine/threonine protein kinase [Polyangium aurulentum]|nr:serine/threonine protein kinase [Polyangium aurulentum]
MPSGPELDAGRRSDPGGRRSDPGRRNSEEIGVRRSGDFEAQPTSRRSFEDLLPASKRGDNDPDIPPPEYVEPERAPGSKDPYIGTTFDHRYKIEKLLGEGGMGYVYLARHKVIDKKVAVKVLRSDMARDREILERFLQEARAASSIGNPHIIDISDFGDLPDGSTYFVMEFLDGKSLIQLTEKTKRLGAELITKIAIQMANGLAAAHERSIIHRDLKPENVFIIQRGTDKEFVKILDFGIAKVATDGENKLTRAGAVFGTPHYMSPEQAAGAPLDHRTDIYSLGVMLYEMASGQLPFVADNFMGILSQHMYQPPAPFGGMDLDPPVPPGLEAIIFKCMSKQPDQRYPDMDALAADLKRLQDGDVPEAVAELMNRTGGFAVPEDYFRQKTVDPGPIRPKRRPWIQFIAVGAVVMGASLTTVLYIVGGGQTQTKPTPPPTAAVVPTVAPPAKMVVLVLADPQNAVASYEGKSTPLPTNIEVEQGKPLTVEVKADGYASQIVTLNGTESRKLIKLDPLQQPTSLPMPDPTTRPFITGTSKPFQQPNTKKDGATGGGSDVIDPWGGNTKKKAP